MKKIRIGIIGGGLAGLTAAYQLSKENFGADIKVEMTLIEATSNVGGRVRTLRDFSSALYAEAGAISLTDKEHEMLALIRELRLELVDRSDRAAKKYFTSEDGSVSWVGSKPSLLFKKYILDYIPKNINDINDPENLALDNISMLDFIKLNMTDNEYEVIQAIQISLLGLYCDDLSKLSALSGFRWMNQYVGASKVFSIKGGNDLLPLAIASAAKNNGVTIVTNTAVLKVKRPVVDSLSSPITLIVREVDQSIRSLVFDYVVMATPLTALQNGIQFEPALPQERQVAIDAIHYNNAIARIYYEFNDRFWLNQTQITGMTITDHPTTWIEDHTAHLEEKSAVIEVHASGQMGRTLLNDEDAFELAAKELSYVWSHDKVNAARNHNPPISFSWNEQPYQKGAYPYLGVGQSMFPLLLGSKLPALFFAGEYTETLCIASMNGAVRSANRVCSEVKAEIFAKLNQNKLPNVSTHYASWYGSAISVLENVLSSHETFVAK